MKYWKFCCIFYFSWIWVALIISYGEHRDAYIVDTSIIITGFILFGLAAVGLYHLGVYLSKLFQYYKRLNASK